MTGRIRTLKPEWLEDELLAAASDEARVLSVALILMADDYGRGRASIASIAAGAWRYQMERDDGKHAPEILARASRALRELLALRFVLVYEVEKQRYFAIRNWGRHQKVDRPSKPRIPEPPTAGNPDVSHAREDVAEGSRVSRECLATPSTDPRDGPPTSDLRPVPPTGSGEHAREPEPPGPYPAGIVQAAYTTALGAAGGVYRPRTGDATHFREAAESMRALEPSRPLRDVAADWCAAYVQDRRQRSPEWLAEWAQKRAAGGSLARLTGRAEPLPAEAYQGTSQAELVEMFGDVTPEELARVERGIRHG